MIFVDLFGGSFYISYLIHKLYPNNRIICNDFDNYIDRLRNVDKTRELLEQLNKCKSREYKYHEKLDADDTQKMKEIIKSAEYIDVPTLVSRLCFSSINCDDLNDLLNAYYYNRYNKVDEIYNFNEEDINEYIEGIEFRNCDWKILFNEFKDNENVICIADPPYFNTSTGGYKGYEWKMKDLLDTLMILEQNRYLYFTSQKTHIIEIINYAKKYNTKLFDKGSIIEVHRGAIATNTKHETNFDVILYKF